MGRLRHHMKRSYIWSLPTRVFHILFAVFITMAFLTDEDRLLNVHAMIGYSVLILLLFRVFWGFLGPKHSRFSDFDLSKKSVKEFINNMFSAHQKYVGHNPLASYVMILMLVVTFLTIITGVLAFGIQEGKGIFAYLNSSFFKEMKLFKEVHETLSGLLIALIVMHLGGIVFDRIFHKEHETLNSIVSGYKKTQNDESIALNIFQKAISFLFIILFVAFLIFNALQPKNVLIASINTPIDYESKHELFVQECGSCHTLYPPKLLPEKSWRLIMADLENHFGDDASLNKSDELSILNFLTKYSAENSKHEASVNILDSIGNKDIIAITKTNYWKRRHHDISNQIFKHDQVKSKANCKACHSDVEKGFIEDENIKDTAAFM